MKKTIITIGIIIGIILFFWFIFGNQKVKQLIEKGRQLERLKLQIYWDSISFDKLKNSFDIEKKLTDSLKSQNKAITEDLLKNRDYYQNKIKSLQGLKQGQIDTIFRQYATDSVEAVTRFLELSQCEKDRGLLSQQVLNLEKISISDSELIDQLMTSIETDHQNEINLRMESDSLKQVLAMKEIKLHRRTIQRNATWLGVVIVATALFLAN
jgi:hypothetical protein